MTDSLLAGVAKRDITPPTGTHLSGFVARLGPATAVRDSLWAKACVLQQGAVRVAVVTLDLLGLNPKQTGQLKLRILMKTGIENVMVLCSHTHSAPATGLLPAIDDVAPGVVDHIINLATDCVAEANNNLQLVRVSYGAANSPRLEPLVRNRRHAAGPTDPSVQAVCFHRAKGGDALAVLYRYTCHPVVLGPNSHAISADWAGQASRTIETMLGNNTMALFGNGPAGNINPSHRGTWDIAQRMGRVVGEAVVAAVDDANTMTAPTLRFTQHAVALDMLPLFSAEQLEQLRHAYKTKIEQLHHQESQASLVARRSLQVFAQWTDNALAHDLGGQAPPPVTVTVQALGLGSLILVALPGEVFVEYGLALHQRFGPHIVTFGYANGSPGYIPWPDDYEAGGYEIDVAYKYYGYASCVAPAGGRKLLQAAEQAVASVLPQSAD